MNVRTIRSIAPALLAICVIACSSSNDAPSPPTTPVAPPPKSPPATIVISHDTMSATTISGAATVTREFEITAGTTTAVSGLVAAIESATNGWITATLSAETAPARLSVTIKPTTVVAGTYDAIIRVAATGAEAKSIRVSLTVKPRPRLALDKTTIAFAANLGDSITAQTVAIAGIDGAIDSLAVAEPDCGTGPAWVTATLSAEKAPANLKLTVAPGTLGAGTYSCAITVSTAQALVDSASQVIRVSLALKAVPKVGMSIDTVRVGAIRGTDAPAQRVNITNVGTGTLSGLTVGTIDYSGSGTGWLAATLDSTTAPAVLTLRATARSLSAGTYYATVPLGSSLDGVAPKSVVLAFAVSPVPSTLVASPAQINLTVKQGVQFFQIFSGSVTHAGDNPLGSVGFAPVPISPPSAIWMYAALRCGGGYPGPTPCEMWIYVDLPAGMPLGTHSATVNFFAYQGGVGTTVRVTVAVVP